MKTKLLLAALGALVIVPLFSGNAEAMPHRRGFAWHPAYHARFFAPRAGWGRPFMGYRGRGWRR